MKMKWAVLISVLVSLFVLPSYSSAATSTDLGLGVESVLRGGIVHISHPYIIEQYDLMRIGVAFRNTGSIDLQERIEVSVLNFSMEPIIYFYDTYFDLKPGEERYFSVTYIPTESGYQWVYANASYDSRLAEAWSGFYVTPFTATPVFEPSGPSVTPTVPVVVEEIGLPLMVIEYEDKIEVNKGHSYLLYVMVNNTGVRYGNISFNNILFLGKSIGIPFNVAPEIIHKLETGKSSIFLITLNVPLEAEADDYFLDFTVRSDETEKNGTIQITVKELDIKKEVWRTIQNYLFIIERLKLELRQAALDGANVSIAGSYLDEATTKVNSAISFYDREEYESAMEELNLARNDLERCVLELALARAELLKIVLPGYFSLVIIILIILSTITALLFIFVRRRKRRRERKQKMKQTG